MEDANPRSQSLAIDFRFAEVPPGAIFRATVASTAAAALIWLVGFVTIWADAKDIELGMNGPALLLAFPAAAAGWLGFDRQSKRLLEGTMASRFSLIATAIISIAASGLFMFYQGGALHWDLPYEVNIAGISNWFWALLVVMASFNAISTLLSYFANASAFIYLANRQSPDGGAAQGG